MPHQANLRIINALGRKLGLPEDRVVVTVDKHANTSAASVPLALMRPVATVALKRASSSYCKVWAVALLGVQYC